MRKIVMNENGNRDFADVVAIMTMRYAVLTKRSRIAVLVKPTAKQLRKRGKRGWQLFRTIDSQTDAARLLEESLQAALAEIENNRRFTNSEKRKAAVRRVSSSHHPAGTVSSAARLPRNIDNAAQQRARRASD